MVVCYSMFAAIILRVLYGLDADKEGGELIDKIHESISCTTSVMISKHAVDIFPALRHVPAWVPGAGFQRAFAECKAAVAYARDMPFAKMQTFLVNEQYCCKTRCLLIDSHRAKADLEAPRPRSLPCWLE